MDSLPTQYIWLGLFFFCVLSSCKQADNNRDQFEELASQVVIYRDTYGIPHVFGESDEATVFGYAYARAEDDFEQIEKQFIAMTGRKSEFNGDKDLSHDLTIHAFEIPEIAKKQYEAMTPKMKRLCNAYLKGLDFYLENHPSQKRKGFEPFEPWMLLTIQKDWWTYSLEDLSDWTVNIGQRSKKMVSKEGKHGSNSWAISGTKTKSGSPMLLTNPHMRSDNRDYEVHLVSEEGLNIYGGVVAGTDFFPTDGFNENIAWSQTTNWPDIVDTYKMTFDHPTDSLKYRYGKDYLDATTWTKSIKVKTESGHETMEIPFMKSVHGPILKDSVGNFYSYRIPDLERGNLIEYFYEMAKTENLDQWKKVVSTLSFPYENLIYADKEGNIFYIYNALIAKRNDTINWNTTVDGANPELTWTEYHSFEELPQVLNPSDGFLQNCNSSPFETVLTQNPDSLDYPSYMILPDFLFKNRAKRSRQLLHQAQDITLDDFQAMVMDTYVLLAEEQLPILFREMDSIKDLNPSLHTKMKPLVTTLRKWDKYSHRESIATTLYTIMTDVQWVEHDKTGKELSFITCLNRANDLLVNEFGTWEIPWKKIIRHQRLENNVYHIDSTRTSYPTDGNRGGNGTIFRMDFEEYNDSTLQRRVTYGNSLVMIVEMKPDGPVARSILNYGQSSNPNSAHYTDQAQMFANGKMKPIWFKKEDILKNLEAKYRPGKEVEEAN